MPCCAHQSVKRPLAGTPALFFYFLRREDAALQRISRHEYAAHSLRGLVQPHVESAILRGAQLATTASSEDDTCFQAALPSQEEEPWSHAACS